VAAGIEGLVHISELSEQHVDSPESVLSVGDQVRVKVIEVDVARRRISLSMRQVGGAMPAVAEKEIEADEEEIRPEGTASAGPEAPAVSQEAAVDASAEPSLQVPDATEGGAEVAEAPSEGPAQAPEAPGEAAPAEEAAAADEDVSLEAILEDLRRREGRAE
ncbi:MAG TPA: S1 RNA-binding domain-containing protein, partial [Actinomycetota bacterium]|nr:S1 RNA-binding domain-containing protein [Actinomycetota bacterium]